MAESDDSQKASKHEIEVDKIRMVREREKEIFESMRNVKYQQLMSDCYSEMDSFVQMAIDGISTGALIEGAGGTGKTYRSINMAMKSCDEKDFAYTDSYSTPASFYIWMYKNRDKKVLIVDDCAGFLNNGLILAFLKGALWEVNGIRVVHYMTTKPLKDEEGEYVESAFEMKASIIIITNQLNKKNPHLLAVLSRINYCYVDIPRDELLRILQQIAKSSYHDLSLEERSEVLKFLEEKSKDCADNLNIRTLFKLFQFKEFCNKHDRGDFWMVLGMKLFKKDDKLVIIEKILADPSLKSEAERVNCFIRETSMSQPTYFRLKRQLKATS